MADLVDLLELMRLSFKEERGYTIDDNINIIKDDDINIINSNDNLIIYNKLEKECYEEQLQILIENFNNRKAEIIKQINLCENNEVIPLQKYKNNRNRKLRE